MPRQMTFASLAHATKKKVTRREKFLAEMEMVVPWSRLISLIEPHYPKMGSKGGRAAIPLETMLRIYCLQQWYALSAPPLGHVNMPCRTVDETYASGDR